MGNFCKNLCCREGLHRLCQIARLATSRYEECTLIMIKPDGVQRGLVGCIIKRFEDRGLKLIALKLTWANEELLRKHYENLHGKPFLRQVLQYMMSGPVVPMVWEGLNAVKVGVRILGATDPIKSKPGTVRGDYGLQPGRNLCHRSDSIQSAEREIRLWFPDCDDGIVNWHRTNEIWSYE